MVFLTTGLGGGTGTGATPILANLASEMDILAIAIVTLPFEFEGRVRAKQAEEGLKELKGVVDTVIAIPNERLLQTVNLDTSIQDAFKMADDILRQAVQGISDLITKPGLINLDFADVKSIMKGMGMAFMGTGIASGENRAVDAAQKAISSPLLVDTSIEGAKGVLINITGGKDMTLHEVSKASELIHRMAHPEANIIFGTVIDNCDEGDGQGHGHRHRVRAIRGERGARTSKRSSPAAAGRLPRRSRSRFGYADLPVRAQGQPRRLSGSRRPGRRQYEPYETPTFIRRSKHSTTEKKPR